MEEINIRKKSYYQRNKDKYKKGGKYYYYKSVGEDRPIIPVTIKAGEFILTFD
tara:strand:- start:736 stop:894 length:159 start_codon:yes stop_codon:yes gene_type:complete